MSSVFNKTHYARLGHAVQNLLPSFLQEVLLQFEDPSLVYTNCSRNNYLNRRFKSEEWRRLSNAAQYGYADFDIPLIYSILRNLHGSVVSPTRIWEHPIGPLVNEIEIGDDLERCRRFRNAIIHRGNTNITDNELNHHFDEIMAIAARLERVCRKNRNDFVSKVDYLKKCCMDEATEQQYIAYLKDAQRKDKENETLISDLESKLNAISITESSANIKSKFIQTLQDIRRVEGVSVTLECLFTGPEHKVKWYKNGKEILFDKEVTRAHLCYLVNDINVQAYKLIFSKISLAARGKYKLQIGNESCECNLDITERTPTLISLRQYQEELAEIALTGQNTIICAGTNSGKTYIAFHIIEDHLIKHPDGKVAFINKTKILLGQQYRRACNVFKSQWKIEIWNAEEDDNDYFVNTIENSSMIFMTPQSLSNHLTEKAEAKVSIADFTLIILDECHHTYDNSDYNLLMSYYRKAKYGEKLSALPQILGLTASPGTNKAKDFDTALSHLHTVMANLAVSKLSVVKRCKDELLQYTTIPEKVLIPSIPRPDDPVKEIIMNAMEFVEKIFYCPKVSKFIIEHMIYCKDLNDALNNLPRERTKLRYIQWISETLLTIDHVITDDQSIPRLLLAGFRHLKLYTECLEMNSLLEINQVCSVITQGYASESNTRRSAKTEEESDIISKLEEVFVKVREAAGRNVQRNPDVKAVIDLLDIEYKKRKEDSRFFIFVKTRATAIALKDVLPDYLKSTHLTGSHECRDKGGLPTDAQGAVLDNFRNGHYLCVVATSVAFEGLDIPLCNLMIRYRFRTNEISSFQMRGRVRHSAEGKEIHVGTLSEFETEEKNIRRQYLMMKAIEEVIQNDIDICTTEEQIYEKEEMDRNTKILKNSQRRQALYSVRCRQCRVVITQGHYIRHVNEKFYVVCDKEILKRVKRTDLPEKKMKTIDGYYKRFKATGNDDECGHEWGSIFIYQKCELVALSQDCIKFFDIKNGQYINCSKWSKLPFTLEELSKEDIKTYQSELQC